MAEQTNFPSSLARLMVIGVGGGGGNAAVRMFASNNRAVELVIANTDAQVLAEIEGHRTLQLGQKLTSGLGAGGNPDVGRQAAEESKEVIIDLLNGVDMVFITAGEQVQRLSLPGLQKRQGSSQQPLLHAHFPSKDLPERRRPRQVLLGWPNQLTPSFVSPMTSC